MEKIKDSTYYNNILKFKKLEAALITEKVRINPNSMNKEANIIQTVKDKSKNHRKDYKAS